jgi:protein-S-isoprenylcysteine O-methyltransferase Ste14
VRTLIAAYALIAAFIVAERRLRRDEAARTLNGPYRWVRHPGYAADLLLWLRFGLASQHAIVASSIVAVMLDAYSHRIAAEEAMLIDYLGAAYRDYMDQTSRILPGVY